MNIVIDNEFKNLIPPLTPEEFAGLKQSLMSEGCRDPLVLWGNILIDGHNRYDICTRKNIPFTTVQKEFASREDAILWMIDNQEARRNLTAYARGVLEERRISILQKQAKDNQAAAGGDKKSEEFKKIALCEITQSDSASGQRESSCDKPLKIDVKKELAKRIGTGEQTASRILTLNKRIAQAIEEEKPIAGRKPEELKAQLISGNVSINEAYQAVKKEERQQLIQKQVEEIEQGNIEKPTGLFDVISIDPPWNYGTAFDAAGRRVANPYPEMNQEQLKALDIPAKDNCVMFLWTTQKFIWDAKELLDAWGFTYRAMLVWDKEKIGMGDFIRMQCEFCLIGIKGKPVFRDEHGIRDIIREPRREHSRKPDAFYQLVNSLCVGDKLDFFSRERREGWACYGNDTEKF